MYLNYLKVINIEKFKNIFIIRLHAYNYLKNP